MSAPPRPGPLQALARALHRLIHPHFDEERERLARLERVQTDQMAALRAEVTRLSERLAHLGVEKSLRTIDRRIEHVGERLAQAREAAGRQYKLAAQAFRKAGWDDEQRALERRVTDRLARIARSGRPVIVGPWSGEVGFELLYWIPFVTWALESAGVAPDRIVVVSRGGAAPWYAHLGGRYVDMLAHVTPDTFRARTEAQKKQRTLGPFDREMVRRVARDLGVRRVDLIHPDLMYRLFYPVWKQQATVRRIEAFATHRLLRPPAHPGLAARLPAEYVAVRFYFSDSFPDTPANRAFVSSIVQTLSATTDVVLLNTAFHVDDHRDYRAQAGGRVHTVDDLMTPERNLDVQTAVIAGARAFVGTYGGYAYLAPLCGVNTLAFYSVEDGFFAHHLELAQRVFRRLGAGSLVALDVRSADLIKLALAPGAGVPGMARP